MISANNSYWRRLSEILQRTGEAFSTALQEYKITPKHFGVLMTVKEFPYIAQKDVAEFMRIDRSTVGQLIDVLEDRGYLIRNKASDRRLYNLSLTETGSDFVCTLRSILDNVESNTLSNLSGEERKTFNLLVNKILKENNNE